MGKKVERSAKSKELKGDDDNGEKSPEPYQCNGHFHSDFLELCKQLNMYRPPPVVLRPKRPTSPGQHHGSDSNQHGATKRGKEDKKAQQQQLEEEQESQEDKEIIEILGFKPKTFTIKDTIDYMKPNVQVEMDNPDKQETVTEIFVRSWRIEVDMLNIFSQCFATLTRLHSLHFWRVGFTSERIKELGDTLAQCENIRYLSIEANEPLDKENWHELVRDENGLTKLILRFCGISSFGVKLIAEQLGSTKRTNTKLLYLDLTGNKIGDDGAIALATALRTNRTLLQLSLNQNYVGDTGVEALAEVISQFFLTHDEVVERRLLMSNSKAAERAKSASSFLDSRPTSSMVGVSPPPSRRAESKDRPGSVKSTDRTAGAKGGREAKSSTKKGGKEVKEKEDKSKPKKDEKVNKKDAEPLKRRGSQVFSNASAQSDSAYLRKSSSSSSFTAAAVLETNNKTAGKGGKIMKGGKVGKTISATEVPDVQQNLNKLESNNPLLEEANTEAEFGKLLVAGNYTLLMLNLSRNQITEKGLEKLILAVNCQLKYKEVAKAKGTGILKLFIKGNKFNQICATYKKLEELMTSLDIFYKPPDSNN